MREWMRVGEYAMKQQKVDLQKESQLVAARSSIWRGQRG